MQSNQPLPDHHALIETNSRVSPRLSRDESRAMGKALREKCQRTDHTLWEPADNRPDPVALMEESNQGRMPHLIPIRHGRMLQSPFAFYRGAALNMAADLATSPASGIRVQTGTPFSPRSLCGKVLARESWTAHRTWLSNDAIS